jgi:hypothetical protein
LKPERGCPPLDIGYCHLKLTYVSSKAKRKISRGAVGSSTIRKLYIVLDQELSPTKVVHFILN